MLKVNRKTAFAPPRRQERKENQFVGMKTDPPKE
jgi:hypothetical protein